MKLTRREMFRTTAAAAAVLAAPVVAQANQVDTTVKWLDWLSHQMATVPQFTYAIYRATNIVTRSLPGPLGRHCMTEWAVQDLMLYGNAFCVQSFPGDNFATTAGFHCRSPRHMQMEREPITGDIIYVHDIGGGWAFTQKDCLHLSACNSVGWGRPYTLPGYDTKRVRAAKLVEWFNDCVRWKVCGFLHSQVLRLQHLNALRHLEIRGFTAE